LSPLTTTVNYGVIGSDGRVALRIIYDHRAMDGATVARALGLIAEALNAEIYDEMAELARLNELARKSTTEEESPSFGRVRPS
jgi:hypothetical protein